MEKKELSYDSDIIHIDDDIAEPILVEDSNSEGPVKPERKKKQKRKVKLGVDQSKDIETILITQKLKIKRKNISCAINIHAVRNDKKRRKTTSILRFHKNECKKEAYYNRIVPICLRDRCFVKKYVNSSRCRSDKSKEHLPINSDKIKNKSCSPISSQPLSDDLENFNISHEDLSTGVNISYEELSTGEFSSFEEELDTLIKRSKEREKQFEDFYKAPLFTSTPLLTKEEESTYSCDMSIESAASMATLVLDPLGSQAYSPSTSPKYTHDFTSNTAYSPTMTPETFHHVPSPSVTDVTPPHFNFDETAKHGRMVEKETELLRYTSMNRQIKVEVDGRNHNQFDEIDIREHGKLERDEIGSRAFTDLSPHATTEIIPNYTHDFMSNMAYSPTMTPETFHHIPSPSVTYVTPPHFNFDETAIRERMVEKEIELLQYTSMNRQIKVEVDGRNHNQFDEIDIREHGKLQRDERGSPAFTDLSPHATTEIIPNYTHDFMSNTAYSPTMTPESFHHVRSSSVTGVTPPYSNFSETTIRECMVQREIELPQYTSMSRQIKAEVDGGNNSQFDEIDIREYGKLEREERRTRAFANLSPHIATKIDPEYNIKKEINCENGKQILRNCPYTLSPWIKAENVEIDNNFNNNSTLNGVNSATEMTGQTWPGILVSQQIKLGKDDISNNYVPDYNVKNGSSSETNILRNRCETRKAYGIKSECENETGTYLTDVNANVHFKIEKFD